MRVFAKYGSAIALAAASIGSAYANTYVFDFSGTDNSTTLGSTGNSRTTTATSGSSSVSVRATGWNTDGTQVFSGYLGAYPQGYGVKDSALDHHFVDNFGNVDFILLQFSRPVVLTSGVFNAFSNPVFGTPKDSDATIAVGYAPAGSWTGNLFGTGASAGSVASLFYSAFQSNVTTNSGSPRALNPGGLNGNIVAIGAGGSDINFDGFKLAQLTASAVPEPATWAMMIFGFGAIGFAMRSSRAKVSKVSYAI